MTTDAPQAAKVVSTANAEVDKKMGGGIPLGSLTLVEGQSDAGKSVLAQHLCYGSLISDVGVAYYTAENTVKSLLTQMTSLGLDVTDHFLVDRLRVYPIQISTKEVDSDLVFKRITQHIEALPEAFKVIVVDSLTNVVTHSAQSNIVDFFVNCKELCDEGRTMVMVVHSYAFDESMLIRIRSLCDAHLKLRLEEVGERLIKMMEVSKVRNAERTTGNIISFEVEPGMGMRIIPITKAKA